MGESGAAESRLRHCATSSGPGLAVRILGDITREKVRVLQDADDIFIRGLREYKVRLSGEEARAVLAAGVPADMQNGEIEVSLYDQIWRQGPHHLRLCRW